MVFDIRNLTSIKLGCREVMFIVLWLTIVTAQVAVVLLIFLSKDYQSCRAVPSKLSGKYSIRGNDMVESFSAYCEQETQGGGWMVIQHRFNGSLSFDRNWSAYQNGFGDVTCENWLGLEKVYQLTKGHDYELLIEMKDFANRYRYAKYSSFAIGSEDNKYQLKTLGTYSGTAGDSLIYHEGMAFSTPDEDNDMDKYRNCAEDLNGGWWFTYCGVVALNGPYYNHDGPDIGNIMWFGFGGDYRGLAYSKMMIRPATSD